MAYGWKVKQYFRNRIPSDNSLVTFSSVADAQSKINLTSAHTSTNGSPTTTYALADSDQTLVVTYEFSSLDNQTTWYNAMSGTNWYSATEGSIEYFKVEWLNHNGDVGATTNL